MFSSCYTCSWQCLCNLLVCEAFLRNGRSRSLSNIMNRNTIRIVKRKGQLSVSLSCGQILRHKVLKKPSGYRPIQSRRASKSCLSTSQPQLFSSDSDGAKGDMGGGICPSRENFCSPILPPRWYPVYVECGMNPHPPDCC